MVLPKVNSCHILGGAAHFGPLGARCWRHLHKEHAPCVVDLTAMLLFRRTSPRPYRRLALVLSACLPVVGAAPALAIEQITLQNGYAIVCDHRVAEGATTRLFLDTGTASYIDIETSQIAAAELLPTMATMAAAAPQLAVEPGHVQQRPSPPEVLSATALHQALQGPGTAHNLDLDLLASVVHAESAGRVHARSRAGAQGLMQLMPGTAAQLGVQDAYAAQQNVEGGAAYLDSLLHRYQDNLAFALAAYNAGPAAVDRWHGVPPYPETRAYVARIIHEFNLRYTARHTARQAPSTELVPALAPAAAQAPALNPLNPLNPMTARLTQSPVSQP